MQLDLDKVLSHARKTATPELLDRVTLFREAMEPDALEVLEAELARRGLTPEDIRAHERTWKPRVLRDEAGLPYVCSKCGRAAMSQGVNWHRIWGLVPLFKRTFYYCTDHASV